MQTVISISHGDITNMICAKLKCQPLEVVWNDPFNDGNGPSTVVATVARDVKPRGGYRPRKASRTTDEAQPRRRSGHRAAADAGGTYAPAGGTTQES